MSKIPFPEEAFDYLASAEGRHWWFAARNQIITWVLRSKTRMTDNFLEVGCGTGFVTCAIADAFPSLELEATEFFHDALVVARKRLPRCHFRQLDATTMKEQNAYSCIGSFDVIEHIENDDHVLANLYTALRSGGSLLITVPQHPFLWSSADDYAHHVRRYTSQQLRRKVLRAGFSIKYCSSFVSLLLPAMMLQRLFLRNSEYSLDDEFKIHPLVNASLYVVMQLEFALLRLGIRFPAGGSLLLLACKP